MGGASTDIVLSKHMVCWVATSVLKKIHCVSRDIASQSSVVSMIQIAQKSNVFAFLNTVLLNLLLLVNRASVSLMSISSIVVV